MAMYLPRRRPALSPSAETVIAHCRLFQQVDQVRQRQLALLSVVRTFKKGTTIFRQGDDCPGVYVVAQGVVRVLKIGPSGKEHVLHMAGPGHTFGEVAAIGDFPCPANAEAVSVTTCAVIPADQFRSLLREDHELCFEMISGLSVWGRHLVTLMEDVVLRDAVGRVARFLLQAEPAPDGTVKLPSLKRYVANHLNLTSETFSRTFGRLVEAGLVVELSNGRVRLTDRERLRDVTEGLFPEL
jgi:CRP/FNR family transcriptional regulator